MRYEKTVLRRSLSNYDIAPSWPQVARRRRRGRRWPTLGSDIPMPRASAPDNPKFGVVQLRYCTRVD
uniref:Uncharacterized protein n=1 Tax=Steinernema glaseri TaxID=37863 RepID=A0A1I7YA64_9BILA